VLAAVVFFPGIMSGRFLKLYQLEVATQDGLGLTLGDKVMMRGIQIGEVSDLKLDEAEQVLVDCKIYPSFRSKLRVGTRVVLVPPALFGSPQVTLHPGEGEPLPPQAIIRAEVESSVMDRVKELAENSGRLFNKVERTIEEVGDTLVAARKVLDSINAGEGLAGGLIKDKELPARVTRILESTERSVASIEKTLSGLEGIRSRLEEFSGTLPAIRSEIERAAPKIQESLDHLKSGLANLDRGLERFPSLAVDTAFAVEDARRVLESLKRNFLIRGNLPEDSGAESVLPASQRHENS
jgi:ABC-type transporter Mla subunit MlaD